jgi:hypothetical protein
MFLTQLRQVYTVLRHQGGLRPAFPGYGPPVAVKRCSIGRCSFFPAMRL